MAKSKADSFVLIWDLETSNLNPRFGFMLTAGWKAWRGGKPCPCHGDYRVHMPSIRDNWSYHDCGNCDQKHRIGPITDDKKITKAISDILVKCDAHVTYNGKRYDWRWVQTKRWALGQDLLQLRPHIDLLYTARSQLAGGASLKVVSETDGTLRGKNGQRLLAKTPVSGPEWIAAVSGNEKALKYVETHCENDVLVLEHEYERMQASVWQHPRLNTDIQRCKYCNGRLIKNGTRLTAQVNRPQEFRCSECGKYQRRVVPKSEKV